MTVRRVVITIIIVLAVAMGIFLLGSVFAPKTHSIGTPPTPASTAPIKSTS